MEAIPHRKPVPGKFVWFELECADANRAQAFYAELFGWKAVSFPVGGAPYEMIFAGETPDTMIGGYAPLRRGDPRARWIANVTVEDVDAAATAAGAHGGRVIEAPHALPGVGRAARIADPSGAELSLFKSDRGDPPDVTETLPGRFVWNELHTTDATGSLTFYERVVGFSHRSIDMGAFAYHIVSKGGVDRGGVTEHLAPGEVPHWLPYVKVQDVDAALAAAGRLGGSIAVPAADIPGTGRFGVFHDPTGAVLALLKPAPLSP